MMETKLDRQTVGGEGPVIRRIVLLVVGIVIVGLLGDGLPAIAKSPPARQAAEQMEFGFKAARRGYWQEALQRFELADELTPNQARILNNIAVALEANGRFVEARTTYKAAIALNPTDSAARRNFERFEEFYASHVEIEVTAAADASADDATREEQDDAD